MKKSLLKYLNIVLAIAIGYLGFNIAAYWQKEKGRKPEIAALEAESPTNFSEPERGLGNYAVIYRKNLFCLEEKKSELPGSAPASWKEQLLVCLKLRGTAVGPRESFCIIEDVKEHKQEIYQVGSCIRETLIAEVENDQVTLRKDNDELVLYMDERERSKSPGKEDTKFALGTVKTMLGEIEHPSEHRWVVKKDIVRKAAENASQILSQLYLTPYYSKGKMEGFLINGIKSGSIATQVGIRVNDIVKKVNGEMLDSPRKIFKLYRQLRHLPSVQLEVERNGETLQLTYDLK